MKKAWAILVSIVVGIIAIVFRGRSSSKRKSGGPPPKNTAADVAEDAVQESFKEAVDRIKSATDSDSPADDLADLGNARRR